MSVSIALNILPAIKSLESLEKKLKKVIDNWEKLGKKGTQNSSAQVLWTIYQEAVAHIEDMVATAAETLFTSVIDRTPKHTNRAAGSWAMSWNTEDEDSDIGFLHPDGASQITFYSGKRDWYPEAPVSEKGVKILGVHDWSLIQTRHNDMIQKVIHEFTFTRSWGQRDSKGRMMSHKTILLYNSCPYIEELSVGSFADPGINPGQIVALSIAEVKAMLNSGSISHVSGKNKIRYNIGM